MARGAHRIDVRSEMDVEVRTVGLMADGAVGRRRRVDKFLVAGLVAVATGADLDSRRFQQTGILARVRAMTAQEGGFIPFDGRVVDLGGGVAVLELRVATEAEAVHRGGIEPRLAVARSLMAFLALPLGKRRMRTSRD